MSAGIVHLPWDLVGGSRAACGQTGQINTTNIRDAVTCSRCKRTRKWKEGLVPQTEKEQSGPMSFATTAEQAIDAERRTTMSECMAFLKEGDREAAHFRLVRGFERQVRLAGLDRAVRESKEKEMVDA